MIIEDATGTGKTAKVNAENMVEVHTASQPMQAYVARDKGEAFTMDIDAVTTDGANYWLAIIKNTDDLDLVITSVTLWIQTFNTDAIIEAYLGGTLTYATNGTAVVPTNCNAGSGKTATGSFYVNDGTGNITTVTAGSVVGRFIFTSIPTKWEKRCGLVVPKNSCFMLWSNKNGEVFNGYISFYYHPEL